MKRKQRKPLPTPGTAPAPVLKLPPDIVAGPGVPSRAGAQIPTSDDVDANGNPIKRCVVKVYGI